MGVTIRTPGEPTFHFPDASMLDDPAYKEVIEETMKDFRSKHSKGELDMGFLKIKDPNTKNNSNTEIERKFIVKDSTWVTQVHDVYRVKQAYLVNDGVKSIRVRETHRNNAFTHSLTIKSANEGMERDEVEFGISLDQYEKLELMATEGKIEKKRFVVYHHGQKWEVDVFPNDLVIAEIELNSQNQKIHIPDWIGAEVTDDKSYYNAELAKSIDWSKYKFSS